jgi:hypothetical protein
MFFCYYFDRICTYHHRGSRELLGVVAEDFGASRAEFLRSPERQSGLLCQCLVFTCTLVLTAWEIREEASRASRYNNANTNSTYTVTARVKNIA